MNSANRILRRAAALALGVGLFLNCGTAALAASGFTPSAGAGAAWSSAVVLKKGDAKRTVSGKWTGRLSAAQNSPRAAITVQSGFTGTLTLEDVQLDLSGSDYACALLVEAGATPTIVLKGNSALTSGKGRAGLEVAPSATVILCANGRLDAKGGEGGAGVGGGTGAGCGTLEFGIGMDIDGNTPRIYATGGKGAAGVGGGSGGNGGKLTVFSGLLKATGGSNAQDIGAGAGGKAGTTTMRGGRLLRYGNVGWSESDSAAYREVRLDARMYPSYTVHATHKWDDLLPVNGLNIRTKGLPTEASVFTSPAPSDKATATYTDGIAYIYLPEAISVLTVECGDARYTRREWTQNVRIDPNIEFYVQSNSKPDKDHIYNVR